MADYRTHITTSGILGAAYGIGATALAGFSPVQGALAAVLTGVAGMLPDLDSDSGRPVREVFGLLAAVSPLLLHNRLEEWAGGREPALLLSVLLYVAIRYGASLLLGMVSVHRGMFHSIPAMLIASEATFLAYLTESGPVRGLMALGVALGFASHLVLDEIYSVRWNGAVLELKPSAGSAVKFLGKSWPANFFACGVALTLGYAVLLDGSESSRSKPDRVDTAEVDRRDAGPSEWKRPLRTLRSNSPILPAANELPPQAERHPLLDVDDEMILRSSSHDSRRPARLR